METANLTESVLNLHFVPRPAQLVSVGEPVHSTSAAQAQPIYASTTTLFSISKKFPAKQSSYSGAGSTYMRKEFQVLFYQKAIKISHVQNRVSEERSYSIGYRNNF